MLGGLLLDTLAEFSGPIVMFGLDVLIIRIILSSSIVLSSYHIDPCSYQMAIFYETSEVQTDSAGRFLHRLFINSEAYIFIVL
jgi:hypothetical protein